MGSLHGQLDGDVLRELQRLLAQLAGLRGDAGLGQQVLLAVGLTDEVCPPSTQFAAYNKISSDKSVEIYPDFGHEPLPGHADRIHQFMRRL